MDVRYCLTDEAHGTAALAALIRECGENDFIGLDTEFDRVKTYYPILALVQLKLNDTCYLLDPLRTDIAPVIAALCDTEATVLLFSGDEDLEVLSREAQKAGLKKNLPARIVDLQYLAAFEGADFQKGLQATLKQDLGIELDKSQTRSDWLSRPLNSEQLQYAACDVAYLDRLYAFRMRNFKEHDIRFTWFLEAMRDKATQAAAQVRPEELYMSVQGAGDYALDQKFLLRLRYLCKKRYEYSVLHNEALNRVITGRALVNLAKLTPATRQGLYSSHMHREAVRQHGDDVLQWVSESLKLTDETPLAPPYDAYAPGRSDQSRGAVLKKFLTAKAEAAGIRPELLCSKKIINDYFYNATVNKPSLLERGWMKECVGDPKKAFA